MAKENFIVTPWEVKGDIDYKKLIEKFGLEEINLNLLERIKRHTKDIHLFLRRKIFFAHRDFNWLLATHRSDNGLPHLGARLIDASVRHRHRTAEINTDFE